MLVCDCRDRIDIRNITVRIAQRLQINSLRVILDCAFQFFQIVCIYKGCCNAVSRKGMCQQVVAAAVDCLLCNNVLTCSGKCLDRIIDSCGSGCKCQCCHAAFQRRNSLLQYILCGVGQTSVNISCICQTESCCRMCGVLKYIRSCLVNRYCSGIGNRIRLFLSYV